MENFTSSNYNAVIHLQKKCYCFYCQIHRKKFKCNFSLFDFMDEFVEISNLVATKKSSTISEKDIY